MKVEGEKRYALLLAAKDSDYVQKMYGGYFNVFVGAFGEEGERWDLFRVVEGEFPDMGELENYHAFVISGSPYDAYGNDMWILKLCFLLQILNVMQKKVLGICFGHQVLCRALGGKVGKAYSGWDLGLRKVTFVEDLTKCHFLDGFDEFPPSASIIQCHRDEVWEVPIGAEVIAFSEKTAVEVFHIGDHILGIQGHPELNKDIIYEIIDRIQNKGSIEVFADDTKAAVEAGEHSKQFWEKMCKSFLHGRYT